MPRFVILTHDWPNPHWDLLLEDGERLLSWRLLREPAPGMIPAERIADHRPFYLEYEGPVSGDRGSVSRWDAGTFEWLKRTDEIFEVLVNGTNCRGRMTLTDSTCEWIE